MTSPVQPSNRGRLQELSLSAGLFIATLALFWPAADYGFLYLDDGLYVYDNPQVRSGLSGAAVRWALTSTEHDNWHPLTWLSLELNYEIGGLNPRGYHLTNVLLHAIDSVLLFWALRLLTGAIYRSAFVAALFAFHPLHVESVAWIAERKDVLSAMFWMLTLIAYAHYARRPGVFRYLLVLCSFALGLTAKSMLVTLPCVLLLLDFWPLRRWKPGRTTTSDSEGVAAACFAEAKPRMLFLEKAPLLALSALASCATFSAQKYGGAVESIRRLPLDARSANAAVAYVSYLGKMFWPARLAAFYPHAGSDFRAWETAAAAIVLLAITAFAFAFVRRWPHWSVGWLWYLGTLVPVIGLVQVGQQSMADRYTYIPLIGVWIALTWQADLIVRRLRCPKILVAALATACLAGCMVASRRQLDYWREDRTLWEHAIDVTENNYFAEAGLAQLNLDEGKFEAAERHARRSTQIRPSEPAELVLGNLELQRKRLPEAESHYRQAIRLAPDSAEGYNNLGTINAMRGKLDDALKLFVEATHWKPGYAMARNNAGLALMKQRKFADAIPWFSSCLACDPSFAEAYGNLGDACYYQQDWAAAIENYRRAAELQAQVARHRCNLAAALWESRAIEEARRQYRFASKLEPGWPERAANQAWRLATDDDRAESFPEKPLQLAKQACQATDPATPPQFLDALAAAYAHAGQFDRAATMARRALAVLAESEDRGYAEQIRLRLAAYEAGRPYRELTPGGP